MRKNIKVISIILGILLGIVLLDTIQARIFKNSPFISWKETLEDNDSWVDKGIFMDTYYCVEEKDIVTVNWYIKGTKFTCSIDNENINYNDYEKVSTLKSNTVDVKTLVMFGGILYGQSYKIIDYAGDSKSIGVIDKLIDDEYIPKLNGETNTDEILNALVFDGGNNDIVILYNNEYVLFERVNK